MTDAILQAKQAIIRAAAAAGEGHIPSAFSVLDILWTLYAKVLRHDPANPLWPGRDRFVLSKGHASLALYAVLARHGYFPEAELAEFGALGSRLGGHPCRLKVPGVECSTGSLGHGLPMAAGMALGFGMRGEPNRVFALIGDGEANEGSVWETLLVASHQGLTSLRLIVDHNHSGDRALDLGDLPAKLEAFGFETLVVDGHDHQALEEALARPPARRPIAVVANTIKGKGCPPMENNPAWHHRAPRPEELDELLEGLS